MGRDELAKRADDFCQGQMENSLSASETDAQPRRTTVVRSETQDQVRRRQAALSRVRRPAVACTSGAHGGSIGSQNVGHSRTVAGETTPSAFKVHFLVARRTQEVAAMRCCECASTMAEYSSCCSEQPRIVHLLPCQKVSGRVSCPPA